jgi:hypothetical protein
MSRRAGKQKPPHPNPLPKGEGLFFSEGATPSPDPNTIPLGIPRWGEGLPYS